MRRLIAVLLALFAGIFDASVSSWLPGGLQAVTMSLPLVIATGIFSNEERTLLIAITSGVLLDNFLPGTAGFHTIRLAVIGLGVHLLTDRFVTNRSLIGVASLGVVSVLVNRSLLLGFETIARLMHLPLIPEAHPAVIYELLWICITLTVSFYFVAALTRRFLPLISRERETLPLWRL